MFISKSLTISKRLTFLLLNIYLYLYLCFYVYINIYISTYTCFALPRTHQCGSGERVENNWCYQSAQSTRCWALPKCLWCGERTKIFCSHQCSPECSMNKFRAYIHIHVFRPSQSSSVWLELTSREQLMSPQCSKHQVLYIYIYIYIPNNK